MRTDPAVPTAYLPAVDQRPSAANVFVKRLKQESAMKAELRHFRDIRRTRALHSLPQLAGEYIEKCRHRDMLTLVSGASALEASVHAAAACPSGVLETIQRRRDDRLGLYRHRTKLDENTAVQRAARLDALDSQSRSAYATVYKSSLADSSQRAHDREHVAKTATASAVVEALLDVVARVVHWRETRAELLGPPHGAAVVIPPPTASLVPPTTTPTGKAGSTANLARHSRASVAPAAAAPAPDAPLAFAVHPLVVSQWVHEALCQRFGSSPQDEAASSAFGSLSGPAWRIKGIPAAAAVADEMGMLPIGESGPLALHSVELVLHNAAAIAAPPPSRIAPLPPGHVAVLGDSDLMAPSPKRHIVLFSSALPLPSASLEDLQAQGFLVVTLDEALRGAVGNLDADGAIETQSTVEWAALHRERRRVRAILAAGASLSPVDSARLILAHLSWTETVVPSQVEELDGDGSALVNDSNYSGPKKVEAAVESADVEGAADTLDGDGPGPLSGDAAEVASNSLVGEEIALGDIKPVLAAISNKFDELNDVSEAAEPIPVPDIIAEDSGRKAAQPRNFAVLVGLPITVESLGVIELCVSGRTALGEAPCSFSKRSLVELLLPPVGLVEKLPKSNPTPSDSTTASRKNSDDVGDGVHPEAPKVATSGQSPITGAPADILFAPLSNVGKIHAESALLSSCFGQLFQSAESEDDRHTPESALESETVGESGARSKGKRTRVAEKPDEAPPIPVFMAASLLEALGQGDHHEAPVAFIVDFQRVLDDAAAKVIEDLESTSEPPSDMRYLNEAIKKAGLAPTSFPYRDSIHVGVYTDRIEANSKAFAVAMNALKQHYNDGGNSAGLIHSVRFSGDSDPASFLKTLIVKPQCSLASRQLCDVLSTVQLTSQRCAELILRHWGAFEAAWRLQSKTVLEALRDLEIRFVGDHFKQLSHDLKVALHRSPEYLISEFKAQYGPADPRSRGKRITQRGAVEEDVDLSDLGDKMPVSLDEVIEYYRTLSNSVLGSAPHLSASRDERYILADELRQALSRRISRWNELAWKSMTSILEGHKFGLLANCIVSCFSLLIRLELYRHVSAKQIITRWCYGTTIAGALDPDAPPDGPVLSNIDVPRLMPSDEGGDAVASPSPKSAKKAAPAARASRPAVSIRALNSAPSDSSTPSSLLGDIFHAAQIFLSTPDPVPEVVREQHDRRGGRKRKGDESALSASISARLSTGILTQQDREASLRRIAAIHAVGQASLLPLQDALLQTARTRAAARLNKRFHKMHTVANSIVHEFMRCAELGLPLRYHITFSMSKQDPVAIISDIDGDIQTPIDTPDRQPSPVIEAPVDSDAPVVVLSTTTSSSGTFASILSDLRAAVSSMPPAPSTGIVNPNQLLLLTMLFRRCYPSGVVNREGYISVMRSAVSMSAIGAVNIVPKPWLSAPSDVIEKYFSTMFDTVDVLPTRLGDWRAILLRVLIWCEAGSIEETSAAFHVPHPSLKDLCELADSLSPSLDADGTVPASALKDVCLWFETQEESGNVENGSLMAGRTVGADAGSITPIVSTPGSELNGQADQAYSMAASPPAGVLHHWQFTPETQKRSASFALSVENIAGSAIRHCLIELFAGYRAPPQRIHVATLIANLCADPQTIRAVQKFFASLDEDWELSQSALASVFHSNAAMSHFLKETVDALSHPSAAVNALFAEANLKPDDRIAFLTATATHSGRCVLVAVVLPLGFVPSCVSSCVSFVHPAGVYLTMRVYLDCSTCLCSPRRLNLHCYLWYYLLEVCLRTTHSPRL